LLCAHGSGFHGGRRFNDTKGEFLGKKDDELCMNIEEFSTLKKNK